MSFVMPWAGAFRLQEYVKAVPEALPPMAVEAIRLTILDSRLLGPTQLDGGFTGTLGFSLTFRRDGLHRLARTFRAFMPFVEAALLDDCNAFILNPLVVQEGRGVGAHVDGSLRSYSPTIGCPAAVSVLYVQVPAGLEGGRLRLFRRGRAVQEVTPTPRTLLTFRGDLAHEVTPVAGDQPKLETARISLVVEQYRLAPSDLAQIPEFTFYSTVM